MTAGKGVRPGLFTSVMPTLLLTATVLFLGLSQHGPDVELPISWADKLKHAAGFAVVGYSYLRSAKALLPFWEVWRRRRWAAYAALALGGLLEVLQAMVPYRTAELADFFADAVGVALALVAVHLVDREGPVHEA